MKDKINQMLRDKMFLVILVLGLLTIVAAAGVFTIQRGNRQESSPYLEMPGPNVIAQEEQEPVQEGTQVAGASNADSAKDEEVEIAQGTLPAGNAGDDLAAEAGAGKEAAAPLPASLYRHQDGAHRYQHRSRQSPGSQLLLEEHHGQHQGDHHAELVHRHYLRRLSHLERPEVAQPGGASGQSRQDQE